MRMIKMLACSGAVLAAMFAGVGAARAQSGGGFDLSWNTIDGGGGKSSGGVFELSGTIGQPDAGVMTGGTFTLTGGFWAMPIGPRACNGADVATEGSAQPLIDGPDGFITGIDFDVFITAFFQEVRRPAPNGPYIADLTDGAGSGPPDSFITGSDFDLFVQLFFQGCP